jgi:DNA-binding IscR family transcriptional regulator
MKRLDRTKPKARERKSPDFNRIKKRKPYRRKNPRMTSYAYLPKQIIGELPSAVLAVYPVLCCQANFLEDEYIRISREQILQQAGISQNTLSRALRQLRQERLVKIRKRSEKSAHYNEYRVAFYRKEELERDHRDLLQFRHSLIDTGIWSRLDIRAKRLYITLRLLAEFNAEEYVRTEGLDYDVEGRDAAEFYQQQYRDHKYDFLATESWQDLVEVINERMIISEHLLTRIIHCLRNEGLVTEYSDEWSGPCYLVHIQPDSIGVLNY